MAIEPPDLPAPEDDFDARVLADLRRHGWHCILVADEHHPHHAALHAAMPDDPVHDAAFAYTVGLSLSLHHPEIVLVGRWAQAHGILAAVVDLIRDGQGFQPGDTSDEVLTRYEVRFGAVSEMRRLTLLTYADWVNRRGPFDAIQLILPDSSGRWPDDSDYDSYPQPLLDRV